MGPHGSLWIRVLLELQLSHVLHGEPVADRIRPLDHDGLLLGNVYAKGQDGVVDGELVDSRYEMTSLVCRATSV